MVQISRMYIFVQKLFMRSQAVHVVMTVVDIGACEQIIARKNKGEFQEYMQTEHSTSTLHIET